MRNSLPDHPRDQDCSDLLEQYPADSPIGRKLRKAFARQQLRNMEDVESLIAAEIQQAAEIENRLERMVVEHQLNMHYLIELGVSASERALFTELLRETIEHGGFTLQEAADLAHSRATQRNASGGGLVEESSDRGSITIGAD